MLNYSNIDLEKLEYNKPKKIDGKYIGKIYYDDNDIIIKTPFLKCISPLILSENRFYFELILDIDDRELYNFFADLDDINIHKAYENSNEWFGKPFPLDVIDDFYRPFIRLHNKLKCPYLKIRGSNKLLEKINDEDFKYDNLISVVIKLDGLRFFKQQFTSEWNLVSYEVEKEYEFLDNLDDELIENIYPNDENKRKIKEENEEENMVENVEENMAENEEANVAVNEEENMAVNEEENVAENVEENAEEKIEENKEENKEEKVIDKNKGDKKKKNPKKKIIKYSNKKRIWS